MHSRQPGFHAQAGMRVLMHVQKAPPFPPVSHVSRGNLRIVREMLLLNRNKTAFPFRGFLRCAE
jgi:hypothetical protein